MANPGVGSKFVSVNLNKSYGQPPATSGRIRPAHPAGGGGGMVLLSRPRSSGSGAAKGGPRLSVPPPLNLPSLRKEHERFDQSSASGLSAGGGRNVGSGSGHSSSIVGWTRPGISAALLTKDGNSGSDGQSASSPGDGRVRVSGRGSVYLPPAARLGSIEQSQDSGFARVGSPTVEKAVVLRGEDFPTLHATLPVATATSQQQDFLHQKQKRSEDVVEEQQYGSSGLPSPLDMRPQMHSSRLIVGSSSDENGIRGHVPGGLDEKERSQKLERYLPGPLPIVHLRHTSDWEEDERDTGHGPSRNEAIQEREFGLPRNGLAQTLGHDLSGGRRLRDGEFGKVSSREVLRGVPYGRDVATPARDFPDGASWRASASLVKDGTGGKEIGVERNGMGATPFSPRREMGKDNKYSESTYRDSGGNGFHATINGAQDSSYVRRDSGFGHVGRNGNRVAEPSNTSGVVQNPRSHYGGLPNRYNSDVFQRSSMAKPAFSLGTKSLPLNDPILNFGREKRVFPNGGKPYVEDAYDSRDPFAGGLIGDAKIFKRKKDVLKQAGFHDPVRESFEAELERVQKMQEQERQRVAEEQARALELARREEEERQRLAREEEEQRRRLEEEAREAAWRAEQERLGAVKRAEEQRMAREKEKRQILLEEERRIEAAKQKLLELEARIARRQAEATKDDESGTIVGDERMPEMLKGRDSLRMAHIGDWEDGERMLERITSSSSSDSSSLNRFIETGSRPHSSRDGNPVFSGRGKHSNLWSRDSIENGTSSSFLSQQDHENTYFSRRDGIGTGRLYPRKDSGGGPGVLSSRTSTKGGMHDPHLFNDHSHLRGNRWNFGGDGDHYNRNTELDAEFPNNSMDKFGDIGWGHGPSPGNFNAPYADRLFQSNDADGFSSFGKSRHSMRQPHVLPPASLPSLHINNFVTESECSCSSIFLNEESKYMHNTGNDLVFSAAYETNYQDTIEERGTVAAAEVNIFPNEQKDEKHPPRCDSQSSLSVSSPPDSPTHISHYDLDDSGDFTVLPDTDDDKQIDLSKSEHVSPPKGMTDVMVLGLESNSEDEKWATERNEALQEQEEYDEDDTYHEEAEVHEGDDDMAQDFEDLHLKEQNTGGKIGQVVSGCDKCAEVKMTNGDKFENDPKNAEKAIETQSVSVEIAHPGLVGIGHGLQSENGLSEGRIVSSSKMIDETVRALQDLSVQSPVASPSYLLDCVEAPSSSDIPDQDAVASATKLSFPSQPAQPVLPAASSVLSQAEVPPIKLQFGLFSGPSLIPSPVPAIQIGSIQMPLLHPHVGSSLTHLHQSEPPFFQFGQLRYTSQMSQGILPLAHQTLTIAQPASSAHYPLNQISGGSLLNQAGTESSMQSPHLNSTLPSVHMDNEPGLEPKTLNSSEENLKEQSALFIADSAKDDFLSSQNQAHGSLGVENRAISESVAKVEDYGHRDKIVENNLRSLDGNREARRQPHKQSVSSLLFSNERDFGGLKTPDAIPGSKGKRFIYAVRNNGSRSSVPASEASHMDLSGVQRRARRHICRKEFRLREHVDRRQSEDLASSNYSRVEEKSKSNIRALGISSKSGNKKDMMLNKSTNPLVEEESFLNSVWLSSRVVDTEKKKDKSSGKHVPSKRSMPTVEKSHSGEGNLHSNVVSEDVDAPLQSGVVRVFKQPGIEAPSDEDNFIEVRSKRQMLNDRREQREKEIKAKSRAIKAPRKPRSASRSLTISANSNKRGTSSSGEIVTSVHSEPVVNDGWASANDEVSTGFSTGVASPPLPPIGTPAMGTDANSGRRSPALKSVSTRSAPVISSGRTNFMPGLPFENKNAGLDNVVTPFGSWASVGINQQAMTLTQTQVDGAMKSARFEAHVPPIGDHPGSSIEPGKPSTPILTQEKSFSSSASPLSSLLAGEKIQFGAVTSPTILPPSTLPTSSGIGPPGSCMSDVSLGNTLPASGSECTISFDKEKQPDASCVQIEDPEAEAEAAASAIAVAAISSDDLVVTGLGASSVSVSDTRGFGGADIPGSPSGVVADQKLSNQSRGEESLTVALPADLSVETPSLWPALPSPQNSSGPLLSHFPGAPPPHFPCYEMNHMFGGPIFAFGPHDESGSTQLQSQKSSTAATGSLGAWQPCHSVDSFYGPSAGFTGPFISPGGIPGVQGPPHMVLYNHFAPVGQFRQVGLSFMGTTYIPSGNQPDWKHAPISSAVGINEGDIHNLNNSSGQHNSPNITASIQHLAPGSPLLPIASPVAMFDLSPFQSSADVPVQARWPNIPTSAFHSVPPMPPLQHQAEGGGLASQFGQRLSVDASNAKSFQESCSSTSADSCRSFPQASGSTPQFPGKGLIEPSSATSVCVQASRPTSHGSANGDSKAENFMKSSSRVIFSDSCQTPIVGGGGSSSGGGNTSSPSMGSSTLMAPVNRQQKQSAPHKIHPIGYTEQRGSRVSQKFGSGSDWHRRAGFQGRNQNLWAEKNFPSSKMKQIYVPKPATRVPTTTV
ncbi:hypothetical protein AAC387_Pa07g0230 [Persea americana]